MDLAALRALFPALTRVTYLNSPTAAPACRPVLEAVRAAEDAWASGQFDWQGFERDADATRDLFARMIGGRAEDVALVGSVAEGAATVAAGLPPGRVVVGGREFRSNLFPWLALEKRGFEVVVPAADGVVSTSALCAAITPGTVLAAVTEVQSANGYRVRLAEIGAQCRRAGARFFVNAMQSLGALRFDADEAGADYVVSHGYKWLLAPRGAAWLWVRPGRLAELSPLSPGWKSVADPYAEYYGGPFVAAPGARRLDASLAWFSWVGARAALALLAELDAAEVERHCLGLAAAFRREAAERGFTLAPAEAPSQTLAIAVPDPDALRRRLDERRVIAAVRGGSLRVGFHAYNDATDVEAALAALGSP